MKGKVRWFVAIVALLALCVVSGCGGGASGGSTAPVVAAPPQKISTQTVPMIVDPAQVPPAPTATDTSTAGADVNNNGIRDDMERLIATSYPNSAKARAAAAQVAFSLQKRVTTKEVTSDAAYTMGQEAVDAVTCFTEAFPLSAPVGAEMRDLVALQLNSKSRVDGYVKFEASLGSRAFLVNDNSCSVPADQLPN